MTKFVFYNKFISCLYMFRAHVIIMKRSKLRYTACGIITRLLFSFSGYTKIECLLCLTSKTRSKTQES